MVETAILSLASQSAVAAGTSSALATAGGVATAGAVASSTPVLLSAGGTLLSAGSLIAGVGGSILGGQQQAAAYKAQAIQYELSAKQEELRGRQQADAIRRTLQANLATQRATFSARGVNPYSGSPLVLAQESQTAAGKDIETAIYGAGMKSASDRLSATQARLEGKAQSTSGMISAAQTLYGGRDQFGSLLR